MNIVHLNFIQACNYVKHSVAKSILELTKISALKFRSGTYYMSYIDIHYVTVAVHLNFMPIC